ncbi:hypothetical protein EDD21DRAFT_332771 [Dissophora ornata]|nr:hypothetical protein EDD21DRAFT_332771 [Dissophora ornata]
MRISAILSAVLLAAAVVAAPVEKSLNGKRATADRGSYTVSGLGARKKAVLSNGGDTLAMAVAMLETEKMSTNYTYGDGKTGDSGNFGIFKQNWLMIRQAVPQYSKYTGAQWNAGAALNSNLSWDVKVLKAAQSKWGIDLWFAGHRDGESGFQNPNTADIQNYRNAVYWIKAQIDSNCVYRTDDTRFWVSVPAI